MATVRKDIHADPAGVARPTPTPSQESPARLGHSPRGIPWHAMSIDEVLQRLSSDEELGLSPAEAQNRLQRSGSNTVRVPSSNGKAKPWWRTISWGMPHWGRNS